MDFVAVLNNPVLRVIVDAIEDTISSLRSYPEGDEILESVLKNQITELKELSGFEYQVNGL